MAKTTRIKVHVQGDARPISLGKVTAVAVVRHRDIQPLLAVLELKEGRERWLTNELRAIMVSYLTPIVLAQKLADHAATMRILVQIAAGSTKLAAQLSQLGNPMLRAIEVNRKEPGDQSVPEVFDVLQLTRKLIRLSHAVDRVREPLKSTPEGRPANAWLEEHVARLLVLLKQVKLDVTLRNSGSGPRPRRRVEGRGGELLVALFEAFDPHRLPNLWGAIDRVQSRATAADSMAS